MNTLTPFHFETNEIRVLDRDGEVWFVAADVCAALGGIDASEALNRLDKDEKGTDTIGTLGGHQDVLTVNESGLYVLILTSRKPGARRFKRWVTHDVLPAIRKTGSYAFTSADVAASVVVERSRRLWAASKIHRAYMVVARTAGMSRLHALKEANEGTLRESGVDWDSKIHVHAGVDTLPATLDPTPEDSVALFLQQWRDGECPIEYEAVLSRELFEVYRQWCDREMERPLNMTRFVHAIARQWGSFSCKRMRWQDAEGNQQGPHGFIIPPGFRIVQKLNTESTPSVVPPAAPPPPKPAAPSKKGSIH